MKKKNLHRAGAAVLCALVLTACGNEADTGTPNRSSKDMVSKSVDANTKEENKVGDTNKGEDKVENANKTEENQVEDNQKEDTNDSAIENKIEGMPEEKKEEGEDVNAPEISFEILSDIRTDSEGNELIYAQYPVFSVSGEGYEALAAVLGAWNEEFKNQAETFLEERKEDAAWYRESVDTSYQYGQKSYVSISRCDKEFVSILISWEEEAGGPHPNYYSEALNFFSQTGGIAQLADIITVDDALKERIKEGLHQDYQGLEFDDTLLEKEIGDALANGIKDWYFVDGNICVFFPEGSFGFGHAEGSLGILIPAEIKE